MLGAVKRLRMATRTWNFGGLSVEGEALAAIGSRPMPNGHERLAEQRHAVHLRPDAASAVVAGPLSPDRPTEALDRVQGFVAARRAGTVLLPRLGVTPRRDDRLRPTAGDGISAGAVVVGAVRGHRSGCLTSGDLRQQVGRSYCKRLARDSHREPSDIAERHVQARTRSRPYYELVELQRVMPLWVV